MILALLFGVVLVPFLLLGGASNTWIEGWLDADGSRAAAAAVIISALTLDVFLPVPSSLVSTASGALLGLWLGVAVSTVGMTLGCILGYWSGRRFGVQLVVRLVAPRDLEHVRVQFRKSAGWALALSRPVPVLAEASTLLAGLSVFPVRRFLVITFLANAGVSTIYSIAGVNASEWPWFLLAIAASCALPGVALLVRRFRTGRRELGELVYESRQSA